MRKEGRFVSFGWQKVSRIKNCIRLKNEGTFQSWFRTGQKESRNHHSWAGRHHVEEGNFMEGLPCKILDTVLFQLGLHFALRAGQEHRNLRFGPNSQITVCFEQDGTKYLEYKEDVSKTNRGGLQHKHPTPKITRAYQNTNVPERCPVLTYEKYISLRQVLYIYYDLFVIIIIFKPRITFIN